MSDVLKTREADPMDRLDWHDDNPVQPLTAEQYAELKQSIQDRGYLAAFPVVLSAGPACEGQILDGFHRSQVCDELGIVPVTVTQPCSSEAEFHVLQVEMNVARRQMSGPQIAYVRYRNQSWYQKLAEERRIAAGQFYRAQQLGVMENFPEPQSGLTTRDEMAQGTGMSGRTLDKAVAIFEAADTGDETALRLRDEYLAGQVSVSRALNTLRSQSDQSALDDSIKSESEAERQINDLYYTQHSDTAIDERARVAGEIVRHLVEAEALLRKHAVTTSDIVALRSRPHTFKGVARRLNEWLGEMEDAL